MVKKRKSAKCFLHYYRKSANSFLYYNRKSAKCQTKIYINYIYIAPFFSKDKKFPNKLSNRIASFFCGGFFALYSTKTRAKTIRFRSCFFLKSFYKSIIATFLIFNLSIFPFRSRIKACPFL
ncbi:MAG TPA: hypothetical protein DDY77_04055 [Clostridiales bacterium]|nr:hypothetical protein [Clostridiales bacterium]